MTGAGDISVLICAGVIWLILDFMERKHKQKYFSFRSDAMNKKFVCPICDFSYSSGGLCPNPDHEPREMVEQNLANKVQDPAPTEIIRKALSNESGEIDL